MKYGKKINVLKPQTLFPRSFLGIFRRNSEEDKGFLGIPSEYSEELRVLHRKRRRSSTTYDAGVCSASGDDVYYGHIHEILEIKYLGMVGLRCTVFYCDWHDNTPDRAEDLAGVGLVVDLTDFGEEAVVHVEDEPVIGEFHQDPDSDSSGDDDSETD
ncbi:hypothetical protein DY000_02051939 [Brassica cretica]|uniref:DUF4216 domain-containing protein n=1 Tax=Brassica cretica TaxID=69181 RepID=A0ABQ7AEC6_BRACR|nr:hypothetical protein DY000_02051939 [Brassica cretica]